MTLKSLIIHMFIISPLAITGQEIVKLDEVVKIAIENNFNIKIAKNDLEISALNATIGNAGFLPTVDFSAGYNYSNTISKTTFHGGFPDQNNSAAASQNYNANLNLNYTLFDGLKPVYKLKRSKLDVTLRNTQYKQAIENTIYEVIQAYYSLAILQEDYRIAEQKLSFTKVQLDRIETKRKYGQGTEVERLNLLTSYNKDSTQLLRLKLNIRQSIRQINKAIGTEDITDAVIVKADTDLDLDINYEKTLESALQNNLMILQANQNITRSKLDLKIAKTELYPKLNTTISYGYTGAKNDVGIMNSNDAVGPSVNLGLSYSIYSAGALNRAIKQNKLNIKGSEITLQSIRYEIEQNIKDAYTNHQNNIALIPLEESNVSISKENFERTTNAYNLGQATYLDYQQAELNYIQAQKLVITARYNAKLSEWELRKLAGTIAK